ncbi:hypothetical protein [Oceanobacillus kimchii]|nr:hypothetical protein [Oceanobacillus kimchii]
MKKMDSIWVDTPLERTFKLAKVLSCKVDDLYIYEDDEKSHS